MTNEDMHELFHAFNRHDIDAVMAYFADDIVFDTVAGDQAYGTRIKGRQAVKERFEDTWGTMPDVQWINGNHYFAGDRVISESTFVATQPDGKRIEADGVDIFTFRDGKIIGKQAFRKQRPAFDPA
ncbi:nuclear transport factor 2 family protein [Zobellella aerophila]|uniref:Nuclear transport factor 2 family protein n=1 Tax=Zobellella aerophila TaxID=870480 RepID=A0ABP6WCW2_9GAMM